MLSNSASNACTVWGETTPSISGPTHKRLLSPKGSQTIKRWPENENRTWISSAENQRRVPITSHPLTRRTNLAILPDEINECEISNPTSFPSSLFNGNVFISIKDFYLMIHDSRPDTRGPMSLIPPIFSGLTLTKKLTATENGIDATVFRIEIHDSRPHPRGFRCQVIFPFLEEASGIYYVRNFFLNLKSFQYLVLSSFFQR